MPSSDCWLWLWLLNVIVIVIVIVEYDCDCDGCLSPWDAFFWFHAVQPAFHNSSSEKKWKHLWHFYISIFRTDEVSLKILEQERWRGTRWGIIWLSLPILRTHVFPGPHYCRVYNNDIWKNIQKEDFEREQGWNLDKHLHIATLHLSSSVSSKMSIVAFLPTVVLSATNWLTLGINGNLSFDLCIRN